MRLPRPGRLGEEVAGAADEIEEANRSPESAAVTGGVPAAAEPPPQTRARAWSAVASTYLYLLLGLILLLTALLADQDSSGSAGTAIAGIALIAIAVMSMTGLGGPATIAVLGFVGGVLLTITAFSAADFRYPQLILLVAGAATFIGSFASLAASRRPGDQGEEPSAGVENV